MLRCHTHTHTHKKKNPVLCLTKFLTYSVNTLRPRQNGRHFADEIFKYIFLNENVWIPIKMSLNFVPMGRINNIPALVQIMAWRRPGGKQLSEPMMVRLPTHICVTRPQWVTLILLRAKSFWSTISTLAFLLFFHIQVAKIFGTYPPGSQWTSYLMKSMPYALMTWRGKQPEHQLWWRKPSYPGIFRSHNQKAKPFGPLVKHMHVCFSELGHQWPS